MPIRAESLVIDTVQKRDTIYPHNMAEVLEIWTTSGCGLDDAYDCVNDYQNHDSDDTYLSISTAAADVWWTRGPKWQPSGWVKTDSIRWRSTGRKTGGTNGRIQFWIKEDGVIRTFDASGTMNTTYTDYIGDDHVNDPETLQPWTIDSINSILWGIDRSQNPSVGNTIRVTRNFMEIFWQQRVQYDTLDAQTEIFDNFINSGAVTQNNGARETLFVARSAAGSIGRALYWLSTGFYDNWSDYYIDSAFLDAKTNFVGGGTHDLVVHRLRQGSNPGTAQAAAQNGSSAWDYAKYHPLPDAWIKWQIAGVDSTEDDNGRDRVTDYDDSVRVTDVNTVYTFNVTAWVAEQAGFNWVVGYPWPGTTNLPLAMRIRQLGETSGDSQVAFHSMEADVAADRPKIRVYGHGRWNDADNEGDPPIQRFGGWDTVFCHGSQGSSYPGTVYSVGFHNFANDTTKSRGRHEATGSASWAGLEISSTTNSNDWANNHFIADILYYQSIFDTLYDNCIGTAVADTQYIVSATLEFTVATKAGSTTNIRGKVQGPVLQRAIPPNFMNGTSTTWTTPHDSASSFQKLHGFNSGSTEQDTVWWRTDASLYDSANALGDSAADYDQAIASGSNWTTRFDLGKYSEGGLAGHVSPVIINPNNFAQGNRINVDVTDMFKQGLAAVAKSGGVTVRDMGFAVFINWVGANAITRDSLDATYLNTRIRFTVHSTTNGNSAALRVITNTSIDAVCANKQAGTFDNPGYLRAGPDAGKRRIAAKQGHFTLKK